MAFKGRLAIITDGLGHLATATGLALRDQGADLALLHSPCPLSRKDEVLQATYGTDQHDIATYECDITSEASICAVFKQIAFDISFNDLFPSMLINAGDYVSVAPLEDTSMEEAMKILTANLLGPFIVSNAFVNLYSELATHMDQQPHLVTPPGRIVSVSNQAAHTALRGHGAYCASKAGLNSLTRCMAKEWGDRGIISSTISPEAELMMPRERARSEREMTDDTLASASEIQFSATQEVANAIAFLCRDESEIANGADVRIVGGELTFARRE